MNRQINWMISANRKTLSIMAWMAVSLAIGFGAWLTTSPASGTNSEAPSGLGYRPQVGPATIDIVEPVTIDTEVSVEVLVDSTVAPRLPEVILITEVIDVSERLLLPEVTPVVVSPDRPELPVSLALVEAISVRDALVELVSEGDQPVDVPDVVIPDGVETPVSIEIDERIGVGDSGEPSAGGRVPTPEPGGSTSATPSPQVGSTPTTTVPGTAEPVLQPTATVGIDPVTPSTGTCSAPSGGGRADMSFFLLAGLPGLFFAVRRIRASRTTGARNEGRSES